MPDLLAPHVLRNLGQKEYDKRKGAALEIEQAIQELRDAGQGERVDEMVAYIVRELAVSPQPNLRKGALHALAGAAIGLREDLPRFLPDLLPPVLASFVDPDCRVRYYACESLYNIAKVGRASCVPHFNDIFEALFKLSADTDLGVQNGFQLLDRLMKDIVAESEAFDIGAFMPLLRRRIFVTNSYTRQFLIGWIAILDSVPDIDMLQHLPDFFDGLFHMLSDLNKEIRQQAYAVLYDFLQEIKSAPQMNFEPIVAILVQHCASRDRFSRLTALTWLHSFIALGKEQLLPFSPQLLGAVLKSISHPEEEIRDAAASTDRALRALLQTAGRTYDVRAVLAMLVRHVRAEHVRTRLTALGWITMLLAQCPSELLAAADELWPSLLDTLGDEAEEVVHLDIEVIARLAAQRDYFGIALGKLVGRFAERRELLEARAPLILRQLSSLLQPRRVYCELATIIGRSDDLPFCALMVQTLNGILHTSPALSGLRDVLRTTMGSKEGAALFLDLYPAWCHSPVAVLSLCLLAQVRHAARAAHARANTRSSGASHATRRLRGARASCRAGRARACAPRAARPRHRAIALTAPRAGPRGAGVRARVRADHHLLDARAHRRLSATARQAGSADRVARLCADAAAAARARAPSVPGEGAVRAAHAAAAGARGVAGGPTARGARRSRARAPARPALRQSGAFQTLQQRLSAVPQLGLLRLNLGYARDKRGDGAQKPPRQLDFAALQRTFESVQARYREQSQSSQERERLDIVASALDVPATEPDK